jgi:RND superfamily putative drug exporter
MAQLLQRLGRFCADYAGRVLAFWAVILLAIGGAAASFGTPMTNEFRFPGAAFEKVGEDLGAALPELRGGFGTVVFETQSGEFTPAQREAIKTTLAKWQQVPQVTGVVDPFAAQERIDAADDKLATAKVKLDQGYADLAANRTKLDQANYSLAQGQGLIELAERKNPKDPGLTTLRPQVAAAEKKLAAAEAKWEQGRDQLDAGWAAYTQGKQQADALGDVRFVSQDGHVAVAQIRFDTDARSVPYEIRAEIPAIGSSLTKSGVTVNYSAEIAQEMSLVGPGEIIGLGVALLVLLAMLGSLVAAGLPLVGAMLGVGVGLGGAVAATHFFAMNQMTPSLALMLGLAVGIDYALFIVNRHRQMYLGGTDLRASIARAVGTAGSAVAFAGLTVIIALTALVLSGLPILAQMGLVAAGTVLAAVLVALTVTPALLRVIGPRVAAKKTWRNHGYAVPGDPASRSVSGGAGSRRERVLRKARKSTAGGMSAWSPAVPGSPRPVSSLVIAVLAAPLFSLRLGLPDGSSEPASSTAYAAYEGVATNFGPGVNGPIVAVATLDKAPADDAALQAIQARLASTFGGIDGVAGVAVAGVSADQRTIAMQVVPTTGPAEAPTVETVNAITDRARFLSAELGADIGVTGQTVANIEISQRLSDALPGYLDHRHRVVADHPAAGFPVSPGAADRHGRLPILGRCGLRCHGGGVSVGLARRSLRGDRTRSDHVVHADHPDRGAVRIGDGLPDVPGLGDARGARPRAGRPDGGAHRLRAWREGRDGGGADHVCGVRRVRLRPPDDDPAHRSRVGCGRHRGRGDRPDDSGPSADAPVGRARLVDAGVAGPGGAECRRGRRQPGAREPGRRAGFGRQIGCGWDACASG